ncbi:hypothetical protein LIER_03360 [Lithospermum erythrorhizon]|uniref:Uncharacterized protein n=1 Tax=Lithospermum erythrorhizon TaxID=34254 RepID=A0AAV3NVL6_LITER
MSPSPLPKPKPPNLTNHHPSLPPPPPTLPHNHLPPQSNLSFFSYASKVELRHRYHLQKMARLAAIRKIWWLRFSPGPARSNCNQARFKPDQAQLLIHESGDLACSSGGSVLNPDLDPDSDPEHELKTTGSVPSGGETPKRILTKME